MLTCITTTFLIRGGFFSAVCTVNVEWTPVPNAGCTRLSSHINLITPKDQRILWKGKKEEPEEEYQCWKMLSSGHDMASEITLAAIAA